MKPEDLIHFLSELLNTINELQALVHDYCRELTEEEEKPYWIREKNNSEKVPF